MDVDRTRRDLTAVAALGILGWLVASACANVTEISARCESQVVEFLDGKPGAKDLAVERYPESTSVLPMRVQAGVTRESGEKLKGIGLCLSQFKDPRTSTSEVPDELNLDAGVFSAGSNVGYEVDGIVVERRTIRPGTDETGLTEGTQVEFTSNFYIQGLLVVASESIDRDLSGLQALVEAMVVREGSSGPAQTAMIATYKLIGKADGSVELVALGNAPADGALVQDLAATVPDFALLKVAILPAVQISYTYNATVGVESTLTGSLRIRLVSLPDGTGAGAAFGMPGEKISQTIDVAIGETDGPDSVSAINDFIATVPAPGIQFLIDSTGQTASGFLSGFFGFFGQICGLFGVETAMGFAVMLGWGGIRMRRW